MRGTLRLTPAGAHPAAEWFEGDSPLHLYGREGKAPVPELPWGHAEVVAEQAEACSNRCWLDLIKGGKVFAGEFVPQIGAHGILQCLGWANALRIRLKDCI